MTTRLLLGSLVLGVLAGIGCSAEAPTAAPPPAAAPQPPPITRSTIDEAMQSAVAALAAHDTAKASAIYAPDAVFVNSRGTFETQAGIQAFWTEALKTPNAGKNLKQEIVKWGASGDLAYSLSRFTGGITAGSGHVLAVSQRQPDGSMKTVVQVSIPDPARK